MAKFHHVLPSSGAADWPAHRSGRHLLGEQVRQARRAARWTQEELATEVGIHPCKLSRYERGTDAIPPRLLLKLAERLELSVASGRPIMQKH